MHNKVIFCDFDGTITKEDALNKLLRTYADSRWLEIEEMWRSQKIGSKLCLEKQVNCIDYFDENMLNDFVNEIEIDDYFIEFIEFARENNLDFSIVSDGLDLLINKVLQKYNIENINVFSNRLKIENNKLVVSFPNYNENCQKGAGACKCNVLNQNSQGREIIYIGDGISDICASKNADVIFAKGSLARYCEDKSIKYTYFDNFKTIMDKIKVDYKEKQNAVIG